MTTLLVNTTTDYSGITFSNFDVIRFTNTGGPATATFSAAQFDNVQIATDVLLTGNSDVNGIHVVTTAALTDFSAQTWKFTQWSSNDEITISGTADANTLTGSRMNDIIDGGAGDDIIKGGYGADVLSGGADIDMLTYASSNAAVRIDIGNNTASGGHATGDVISGFENIFGSGFDDKLFGNSGQNQINGGGGNDVIRGGGGADTLDGGGGSGDMLSYAGSNAAVTVDLGLNTASGGHADGDVIIRFEKVYGSNFGDTLTGSSGKDQLSGGKGNDLIHGGAGADALYGGGGGADVLSYENSGAAVTINLAAKTASGGDATGDVFAGFERVVGSGFDDTLFGSTANNQLKGRAGDDLLRGGAGSDQIYGGNGIDTMSFAGSDGAVTIDLFAETASGGHAEGDSFESIENVYGSNFDDTITGDNDDNVLTGVAGADTLMGRGGADTLDGGGDNDRMDGGAGHDTLYGRGGADVMVLAVAEASSDFISGFNTADDQLEVSAATFGGGLTAGSLQASQFVSNTTGLAGDLDDRFILNTSTGELFYDNNGSDAGGSRLIATFIDGIPSLTSSDFDIV